MGGQGRVKDIKGVIKINLSVHNTCSGENKIILAYKQHKYEINDLNITLYISSEDFI